jgi:hypothetical protein
MVHHLEDEEAVAVVNGVVAEGGENHPQEERAVDFEVLL